MHDRRPGIPYFFMALFFFLSIYGIQFYYKDRNNPKHISNRFQKKILQSEKQTKQAVNSFIKVTDSGMSLFSFKNSTQVLRSDAGQISMFVFDRDSLIFWSSNKIILPEKFNNRGREKQGVIRLKNGWYGFYTQRVGRFLFLGSYLIKNEFPIQNNFIRSNFSSQFNCPGAVLIESRKGLFPIFSSDGSYLFSLNFSSYNIYSDVSTFLIFLLFIAGSLCLFYFVFRIYFSFAWFDTRKNLMVLFFSFDILLLRVLQYWSGFPGELTQSEIFSPALYSSSAILPSLGDFTLNIIVVFIICLTLYKHTSILPTWYSESPRRKIIANSIVLFFVLCCLHLVGYLTTNLVLNSSLPLNLQNIAGLVYESAFGFFIITILLGSYWLISTKLFDGIYAVSGREKSIVLSAAISVFLYCMISWITIGNVDYLILLFFAGYLGSYWYIKSKNRELFSVQNLLFILFFYAIFSTFILNRSNNQREYEKRNLLAIKLATRRNPVTEVLYEQLERKLRGDAWMKVVLKTPNAGSFINQDSLINYLKTQYFKDYWQKYDIQVTICDSMKELQIQPQGYLINCNSYFQGIIKNYGEATLLPNLFFLDFGFGKEYYLAILSENHFSSNRRNLPTIVMEFNLLNAYPDPGYPGLLMDNTRIDLPNLSDYSYGLFQNGRLVHSVGTYNYRMELSQYKNYASPALYFPDDGMIHYHYAVNNTNSLLISKKDETFLTMITPFSYLFILFAIIVLLVYGLSNYKGILHLIPSSLRNRLHLSLLGVLVLTLLVIGIVQILNIININSKKNIANLREKAYSIQVEVQHRYGNRNTITEVAKNELEDFLVKLSNVFFTDINFYQGSGVLLASSRQQIFEEGLVSDRMNPEAFWKMNIEKGSAFIHSESIGSMQFSSAYLPLYNEQNTLLGYINLPYFARQDEIKKEISSFLVTFLNIYILLIIFGIFITILVSNYITAPLSMLAEKMSRIKLGVDNDKIAWYHGDEIGQLVSEYNRMIDELGKSAALLAQSERESAWREMARQVAHEIKNPLTPMKLSAQHLQKAWLDQAPDMGERLSRFTKILIEQIDTLSAIASDFSNFAKMPEAVNERVNLEDLILFVLSMYRDTSDIQYDFQATSPNPVIWADRTLLIRIFTNILNNAVQAIGERPDGNISIRLSSGYQQFVVVVSDNGSGISAEQAGKIFQPDFTTKTSGMGLGLAIVKGIVSGMHGEISFIPNIPEGATFIIKIPADDPDV